MANLIYSALSQPRRPIVKVLPHATVDECIKMMVDLDIGALVVEDEKKLYGMITERDIVRSCLFKGLSPQYTSAKNVVYTNVSILNINDPVELAMEVITKTKRRHLLVEENNRIVALLSIGDLLYHLLDNKSREIEHLTNYIHNDGAIT